jgi:hypothetical protein
MHQTDFWDSARLSSSWPLIFYSEGGVGGKVKKILLYLEKMNFSKILTF